MTLSLEYHRQRVQALRRNTYYIYPGYSHDYYHDRDHGYGGHEYGHDHWLGGHQDSGNIGNGGNQNSGNVGNGGKQNTGNVGNGGHSDTGNVGNEDHWFGGHQDAGNHVVTQPVDRLHHLSNGVPMMNEESSDDDE
jgi:hypothetical protein